MKNGFIQLFLFLITLMLLISFESVVGFPWLSVFFVQQKLLSASQGDFWIILLGASFFLGACLGISFILPLAVLAVVWFLQATNKSKLAALVYIVGVLSLKMGNGSLWNVSSIIQTAVSLLVIFLSYRGWRYHLPEVLWKKSEKNSL